jgi:site-specific DNA-cytosine methylase
MELTAEYILENFGIPDVIWASPDCTTYSIAAISHHRRKIDGNLDPVSEYAEVCDKVNKHMLKLISELDPKYYFIENPRGGFRKMSFIQDIMEISE